MRLYTLVEKEENFGRWSCRSNGKQALCTMKGGGGMGRRQSIFLLLTERGYSD